MKDTPQKQTTKGVARENIANLLLVPKAYKLKPGTTIEDPTFLVDEKICSGPIAALVEHTRDELIKMIGLAYPEFVSMVYELDEVKKDYISACSTIAAMHNAASGGIPTGPSRGVVEDIKDLASGYAKARSVLRTIAYENRNIDQARFMADRFLSGHTSLEEETANANQQETSQRTTSPTEAHNGN